MTPLPPNADELVSAYLDGEATPEEIVIVESSPELLRLVDSARALTSLLGQPPIESMPSAATKEAHLGAAMAAFDQLFPEATDTSSMVSPPQEPAALVSPPEPSTPEVASLATARQARDERQVVEAEQRRRRFSPAVIAAAVAALLFFGLVAALSVGRSGDDVATSADATSSSSANFEAASADDSGDAMDDDAMDDEEEAMADEEAEVAEDSAMAEAPAAAAQAPIPTVQPSDGRTSGDADDAGAMADSAEEDAMEEEEAMEEEAMDDNDEAAAETEPLGGRGVLSFGQFVSSEELSVELNAVDVATFEQALVTGEGLFPNCQSEIPELAARDTPSLVGEATVNGQPVEIHVASPFEEPLRLLVVATSDCSIVSMPVPSGG